MRDEKLRNYLYLRPFNIEGCLAATGPRMVYTYALTKGSHVGFECAA